MKGKSKKQQLKSGGFLTNPVFIQIVQPHLKWLFRKREEESGVWEKVGINAGIILFSAIYLEGFFEEILASFIWHRYDKTKKTKTLGLFEIEKAASLNTYIEKFEHAGISLSNLLKNKDREDVENIFYFRHLLAHGQRDSYIIMHGDEDYRPKAIVGGYYQKVDRFLVKRKIIPHNPHPQGNDFLIIFSDKVSDWFYRRVKEICSQILSYTLDGIDLYGAMQKFHLKALREVLLKL